MVKPLRDLPAGAYATHLPRHVTAWVKIDPMLSFFFDPNHGITEISGPEHAEVLYVLLKGTLAATGDRSEKHPNLPLYMDVNPVHLRV